MLAGIHQLLAASFNMPHLALQDEEAQAMGAAIAHVQSFYPDSVLDPKTAAWAALAVTALKIEGPRALAAVAVMKARKADKETAPEK